MCGICGAVGNRREELVAAVERMCAQMVPRGPDDAGIAEARTRDDWTVLGSRRLAIIDPSSSGHQPMHDRPTRTTIVFNGMIYNFRDLRRELEAHGARFESHCDTEVVLRAYHQWGDRCVERLRGMFAFAIRDGRDDRLFLARDRLGIKPLYYAHSGRHLLFASQVKALLESGLVDPALSADGIRTFLEFGAVSEPLTAIRDVSAIPAAHTAVFADGRLSLEQYWDFPERDEREMSLEDARVELRARLEDVVARHLVSDAPLGVFLSGGIDSSVLAAVAARQEAHLRTLSIVFQEDAFSEERYIDAVAQRLGSEHVRITLRPRDVLEAAEHAFVAMDQPTFDGINTYVVSRAAHDNGLKVALSGLGGDELFNGYGHARRVAVLERLRRLPPLSRPLTRVAHPLLRGAQATKLTAWLADEFPRGASYELLRRLFLPSQVSRLARADGPAGNHRPATLDTRRGVHGQLSVLDLANYTKNVLLRDADAMSMANSVEVRVPFLDHELVEWVLRLPPEIKRVEGKGFLIDAMRDALPEALLRRPKQGFVLPFSRWLGEGLRPVVEETLAEPPAELSEVVDTEAAYRLWCTARFEHGLWLQPWALFALTRWVRSIAASPAPARAAAAG